MDLADHGELPRQLHDVVPVAVDGASTRRPSRVICELDNPMRDPGDGTIISATNISIVTYAGDGKWRRQEDVYNPLRFVVGDREVVPQGRRTRHPARRGRGVDDQSRRTMGGRA